MSPTTPRKGASSPISATSGAPGTSSAGTTTCFSARRRTALRVPTQYFPTLSDLYTGLRDLHDPADVVVIPHAHQTGNFRLSDPKLQPLVEIMSQHGAFEWFGQAYLRRGHQVGFTAASDNHLAQPGYTAPRGGGLAQRGGLGGVLADELSRDALFDAMKAARAYATTGDRIILQATVNDGAMGQRVPFAAERHVSGRVIGTGPIDTVTVIKNGEELWRTDYATANRDGPLQPEETFHLTFASPSVPMHRGDNPRGWRPWAGTLEVTGAQLAAVTPTDFFNPDMQRPRDRRRRRRAFRHHHAGGTPVPCG